MWSQKTRSAGKTRRALPTRHTSGADLATGYWSLFNFGFPQCVSLREELNVRSRFRFNALMTPMRANIVGPPNVATRIKTSIAVCHSAASCSAFGSLVIWVPASSSVTSWRPRGNGIGSSNDRFQPRSGTRAPVRRHALVPIEATVLLGRPCLLIAPCLEICIRPLCQIFEPSRFKCRARCLETRCVSISLLARIASRIETAVPFPRLSGVRDP
jgi:hypothetical protein